METWGNYIYNMLEDNKMNIKIAYSDCSTPNIYFLSIALYKKYQGLGIGRTMVEAFLNKIKEEIKSGNVIYDIITSAVTSQGENIMKKYGFELVKDCMDTKKYKLYRRGIMA
jgi:GNAT superfamily N-acetyltransferase